MGIGVIFGALAAAGQSTRVAMIVAAIGLAMAIAGTLMGYGREDSGPTDQF